MESKSFPSFLISPSVTVSFKSREVTVKGPKGTLQRSFKHMSLDIQSAAGGKEIKVDLWFGNRETIAAIRYGETCYYHCIFLMSIHLPFNVNVVMFGTSAPPAGRVTHDSHRVITMIMIAS